MLKTGPVNINNFRKDSDKDNTKIPRHSDDLSTDELSAPTHKIKVGRKVIDEKQSQKLRGVVFKG